MELTVELKALSFKSLWEKYIECKCRNSAEYKEYSAEIDKRLISTGLPLKESVEMLMGGKDDE